MVLCYYSKLTDIEAMRITWHIKQHKLVAEFGKSQRNLILFTRNMHAIPETYFSKSSTVIFALYNSDGQPTSQQDL